MMANKIFFDLYSTCGGRMPYDEYRKWYDEHNTVYIVLVDAKIYTKVKRETMFDMNLHCGCFLECRAYETPEDVEKSALDMAKRINARYVEPEEFKILEQAKEDMRVAKAFAIAENMIRLG